MKLTELGLKNLLESLTDCITVDTENGWFFQYLDVKQDEFKENIYHIEVTVSEFGCDSHIFGRDFAYGFVINLDEQYFTLNGDNDFDCIELSIEQLIRKLRPFKKKAE